MTAKRVGSGSHEQATVSAMLIKLALEGPMRSADLSTFLALDPSTVSRNICSMVDDCLVTKTTDDHDRRVQWITLTPAGRELLLERVRTRTQDFARVTSTWSELERQTFGDLIAKFVNDFDRTLNESEHA
jgi:DNA-binding MarR family transcriptional regulator